LTELDTLAAQRRISTDLDRHLDTRTVVTPPDHSSTVAPSASALGPVGSTSVVARVHIGESTRFIAADTVGAS